MKLNKKCILTLLVFILGFSQVYSATEYKTANGFVRVTTNMLGYNFIAKKVAQGVLKKTLNKSMAGEYDVKFDSFSGVDLKKGKFKGLTIDGKNLVVENELYVTQLHMTTTSDFNYVDYKQNPMVFKTDIPFNYEVELSESDLNKTLTMGDTFEQISSLIPLVKIEKPSLKLDNQKIRISSSLKIPFAKPIKFSMSSALVVENGQIKMADVESSGSHDFADKLVNLINKQNMLENINLNIFDDADTIVKVENVKITGKKMYITGQFVIKKSK